MTTMLFGGVGSAAAGYPKRFWNRVRTRRKGPRSCCRVGRHLMEKNTIKSDIVATEVYTSHYTERRICSSLFIV